MSLEQSYEICKTNTEDYKELGSMGHSFLPLFCFGSSLSRIMQYFPFATFLTLLALTS